MNTSRNMKFLALLIPIGLALFGAWSYTKNVAENSFLTDTVRIKQNFHEGIKTVEDISYSFKSFSEIVNKINQSNFGKYSSDLMKNNPYLKAVTYYSYVPNNERAKYESQLKNSKLGKEILETSSSDQSSVIRAKNSLFYLPITAVNNDAQKDTYFGWNLNSDNSKINAIDKVIKQKKLQASDTFLLDDGRVALDVYVPVLNSINNKIMGIIGVTVDLTKLLGAEQ